MGQLTEALNLFDKASILDLVDQNEEIIGIDPGDNTGWACLRHERYDTVTLEYKHFLCALHLVEQDSFNTTLVVEQFITRPGSFARVQYADRVCGAADYAEYWSDHIRLVYQTPQVVKTMIDPDLLKAGGWVWNTPHELDALRHSIYYLLTR